MKEDLVSLGFYWKDSHKGFYRDLSGPESLVVNKLFNEDYQVLYSYRDDDGQPRNSYQIFERWEDCLDYVKQFREDFSY